MNQQTIEFQTQLAATKVSILDHFNVPNIIGPDCFHHSYKQFVVRKTDQMEKLSKQI